MRKSSKLFSRRHENMDARSIKECYVTGVEDEAVAIAFENALNF